MGGKQEQCSPGSCIKFKRKDDVIAITDLADETPLCTKVTIVDMVGGKLNQRLEKGLEHTICYLRTEKAISRLCGWECQGTASYIFWIIINNCVCLSLQKHLLHQKVFNLPFGIKFLKQPWPQRTGLHLPIYRAKGQMNRIYVFSLVSHLILESQDKNLLNIVNKKMGLNLSQS